MESVSTRPGVKMIVSSLAWGYMESVSTRPGVKMRVSAQGLGLDGKFYHKAWG